MDVFAAILEAGVGLETDVPREAGDFTDANHRFNLSFLSVAVAKGLTLQSLIQDRLIHHYIA